MKTIADYARIFQTGSDDDWVEKRNKATSQVTTWLATQPCSQAVRIASALAESLAGGALPDALANEVASHIRQHAPSFVRTDELGDLQIKVVTCVGALSLVSSEVESAGWKCPDALAGGLWSALWFQQPLPEVKLEELRQDLLAASQVRVSKVAELTRQRRPVPEIGAVAIDQNSPNGSKVNAAFARAVGPMVNALRDNAALDREELDFMWWLLSERSDLLDEALSGLPDAARAVVCGLDAAAKLRRLPARAHRDVVLRKVSGTERVSLGEVIDLLGDRRVRMAEGLGTPIKDSEAVLPLIHAVCEGTASHQFSAERLAPSEWAARALLEGAIHRLLQSEPKL
ncbi:hypothetical protein SAMN05444679_103122 [Variovorax sp. CF079]|uniref:GTPase-associated system all-helical protein GASH n=1 Tax=Variovorax sp. CF079 TaxID=1882774 RepID=UPI0008892359|nr:GTPase-associated system all-helical protein GASH [Variovorax sp. CF079]SDC45894.1 hypothetical protein SAMN05444679_103122 [Variovorax sp. CF079]